MVDYVKFAALAERLITANGRTITLVKPSETPDDPTKPWLGSTGETTVDIPAAQLMPNQVRIFGLSALGLAGTLEGTPNEATKGLIQYSELVYICYPGAIDLREYTNVRDEGVDYTIEATQDLKPGSVRVLGYIGVRR